MAEYITKEQAINALLLKGQKSTRYKLGETWELNLYEIQEAINTIPVTDVQPVIETEDLATATEQFICKNCGIRIENFDKVVLEEDNDGYINKLFHEYRFKFCSECGAKVKEG